MAKGALRHGKPRSRGRKYSCARRTVEGCADQSDLSGVLLQGKDQCRLLLNGIYCSSSKNLRCCGLSGSPLQRTVVPERIVRAENFLDDNCEEGLSNKGDSCRGREDGEGERGKQVLSKEKSFSLPARLQASFFVASEGGQTKQSVHPDRSQPCESTKNGAADYEGSGGDRFTTPSSPTFQKLKRSQVFSSVQQQSPVATQAKQANFERSWQSQRGLLEAVRKRLRHYNKWPHVLKNAEEAKFVCLESLEQAEAPSSKAATDTNDRRHHSPHNSTERALSSVEESTCAATQYATRAKSALFAPALASSTTDPQNLLASFAGVAVTTGILPAGNCWMQPEANYVSERGPEHDAAAFPPAQNRLIFPYSLNKNNSIRACADGSAPGGTERPIWRHYRGPPSLFTVLRSSWRQAQPSDLGDDRKTLRSLISACVEGIGPLHTEESEGAIKYFFEQCAVMCQRPILAPAAFGNLPLLDPTIRKEFRRLTGCALTQVGLRDVILACATKLCVALLKAPAPWHNAPAISGLFTRPALFELLTALIDENQCDTCIGNLIVLTAVATALAKAEKWEAGVTQADNEVMLLESARYAVEKMHPKCCNDIVAIEIALERLKREATMTLLGEESAERRRSKNALRTVGGFWRIELPFALRILMNRKDNVR